MVKMMSTWCCEKQNITKKDCRETLIMALPMKAAPKNTVKGIRKCPQRKPARSKRGFGIYTGVESEGIIPRLERGSQQRRVSAGSYK